MAPITITDLYTYPVKSCAGIRQDSFTLTETGPQYDRNWVITDADGMFYTQRELPHMARIYPSFADGCLVLSAEGMPTTYVPLDQNASPHADVTVWRDTMQAADTGDDVARWLAEFLGTEARLFALTEKTLRLTDKAYAAQQSKVGFPDGYPLLLISEESLDDLNTRLQARGKHTVPMTRFRPNIVVRSGSAFAEDDWGAFTVGEMHFDVVKSCARCAITTVDPKTGQVPDAKEPLATLATFRRADGGKVLFGQNVIHRAHGQIAVGDVLTIV